MGTQVELLLDTEPSAQSKDALDRAEGEFERLEALLSRFHADSELSELNRHGALDACPELVEVTRLALKAREQTDGLFDPTVHDAVVAAGYDRTFDELEPDGPAGTPRLCGGSVRMDGSWIELEQGFRLDLGGIAKGYAVDRVARMLVGTAPCLVNAGGDLACYGRSWPVGVETSVGQVTLELDRGAIATSGRDRRRIKAAAATDVHRFLSLLALGAIALHGLVLTLDQTVRLPAAALVVPGLSPYRPLATGIGVLAAELMALIYASFSLRRRIGVSTWRRLHYLTFGVFAAATVHGLAAGTDRWALGLYTGSIAAVSGLTAWRIITKGGTTNAPRPDRPVAV
jgi:thiamine biosynthesis lipoprotein